MLFGAVGRPRYNYSKKRGFDGKIGIFPIIKKREAKRTTKNQTKGDLVAVPLTVCRQASVLRRAHEGSPASNSRPLARYVGSSGFLSYGFSRVAV
jgi:hypothetical protein